jgi:hypothetical protein
MKKIDCLIKRLMLRSVFFFRLAFEVWHFDIFSFLKITNLTILMITVLIIYLSLGALLLLELYVCVCLWVLCNWQYLVLLA